MNTQTVKTVGIIGLGLIGTSLGMALKAKNPHMVIKGLTRSRLNATAALHKHAVDRMERSISALLHETDLVIIATPIRSILTLLPGIGKTATRPVIVMDTGSTKRVVCSEAAKLPRHVTFIGSHPLAGKEVSGPEGADAGLFRGKPWILTPNETPGDQAIRSVRTVVEKTGAIVRIMTPADHDRLVAGVSHLTFLQSAILMEAISEHSTWQQSRQLAGSGFQDTTRLAAGNPVMHTDILRTNKHYILERLRHVQNLTARWAEDIQFERWSVIEDRLKTIQKSRRSWEETL